jgi:hypothetical protein
MIYLTQPMIYLAQPVIYLAEAMIYPCILTITALYTDNNCPLAGCKQQTYPSLPTVVLSFHHHSHLTALLQCSALLLSLSIHCQHWHCSLNGLISDREPKEDPIPSNEMVSPGVVTGGRFWFQLENGSNKPLIRITSPFIEN